MKTKIIELIKILGNFSDSEILIRIELSFVVIDSIELSKNDKIILHQFCEDDIEINFDFDDIEIDDQVIIYNHLSKLIYN